MMRMKSSQSAEQGEALEMASGASRWVSRCCLDSDLLVGVEGQFPLLIDPDPDPDVTGAPGCPAEMLRGDLWSKEDMASRPNDPRSRTLRRVGECCHDVI